ncbi:hypothetical protein [Nocardia spumae]|uniref:hypothetical protein n=1 Tax=Nocardia spumae TaxID=2887190 RepID=UPI001D15B119|nr:hypothetical protein [Nocardia spumae]
MTPRGSPRRSRTPRITRATRRRPRSSSPLRPGAGRTGDRRAEESADSAIAALAALLTGLPHHVARVREEIERATAEREARIAEEVAKREELAAESPPSARPWPPIAPSPAARERAETEIREARDSRLKTEDSCARPSPIEELEREIAALKIAHRAEIERCAGPSGRNSAS